ncbi:RNA-binding KH domain-containing protein RCF3 [Senna tora]|uniref:RNA-binding KH domain-containing protein RCF3 n=1 Tax=Senna tora TaxID=362788 RepID=A0A834T9G5_9FABA|nr:RNA-binding KH domain-containing protein RCF3 [Senna tora]
MERSRSKRNYYYDQDYDSETLARTRPRYNHHYTTSTHRHRGGGSGGRPTKAQDSSLTVTTNYRILCHDMKAGGVIGKSGSIIKSIRQHTGAWINVHELIPGDEERIIEISDTRRRDPEGRMPSFSPAQEALLLIHERILESDAAFGIGEEEEEYGGRGGGGGNRVATRLVVSRMHVGCLLGKGGKIIEQMRIETKTQIRILPRDHTLPRCVSMSEEIVQLKSWKGGIFSFKAMWLSLSGFAVFIGWMFSLVLTARRYHVLKIFSTVVGDANAVKNAIVLISSRLRESQHRDRSHFHGRVHSPERFFPPDDDYIPHGAARRSSLDGATFGSRPGNIRSNSYPSSGYTMEPGAATVADDAQPFYGEDIIFRILCPMDKVDRIIGESDGFVEFLQNEVGVDVKLNDPVVGSDEQIIIISSEEGPDDELFPAQEALLHIQTRIVDLELDKDNIITTKLVIPSSDIECLDGRDASLLEIRRLTGANIQILPREELPLCVSKSDELVQIVGEIKAARDAVVEVTSRLRSYLYRDFFQRDIVPPSAPGPNMETSSSNITPVHEGYTGSETPTTYQNAQTVAAALPIKESGGPSTDTGKQKEGDRDVMSSLTRIPVPLVTRSTLEVVLPEYAVPKLTAKSKNKLAQISELSGANVTLVEDRPEETQKIIQISGTPEQAERAQSLLQGFILSREQSLTLPEWSLSGRSNQTVPSYKFSCCLRPHNPNPDSLQDKKCGLQVKTNMEDEAKYSCLYLNSWDAELDAFCVVDANVNPGGDDQSIQDLDALSCFQSTDSAQTSFPKSEAALDDDLQLTSKQKDKSEFWFYDDQCVDLGMTNLLASEQCAKASTDLNSHWMEPETIRPWWQTARKDELAYLVSQSSLDNIENCDLPHPQIKVLDHENTLSSSLNQKAETVFGYASGITTSGCSLQDSDIPLR